MKIGYFDRDVVTGGFFCPSAGEHIAKVLGTIDQDHTTGKNAFTLNNEPDVRHFLLVELALPCHKEFLGDGFCGKGCLYFFGGQFYLFEADANDDVFGEL